MRNDRTRDRKTAFDARLKRWVRFFMPNWPDDLAVKELEGTSDQSESRLKIDVDSVKKTPLAEFIDKNIKSDYYRDMARNAKS